MKIIYNDSNIENDIKECAAVLKADFEIRKSVEEFIQDFKRGHEDAIGGIPPDNFIDLVKYLFSFFIAILGSGITYDLIKKCFKKLLLNSKLRKKKNYKYFLISNGDDPDKFNENIYFFIPIEIAEKELDLLLDKIKIIIQKIEELKKEIKIDVSLRFYYENGEVVLKKIVPF